MNGNESVAPPTPTPPDIAEWKAAVAEFQKPSTGRAVWQIINTLVPYAHDAYAEARGDLALAGQELLRLDDEVGLHPALTGLKTLHDAGHVAWVEGVG